MQVRSLSLKKLTYFHQRFKIARVTLDLQASAFPRGELSSTWCEGVHGTLNSKIHYVAGICSFDAEYTSTFDQKMLLKTRFSTCNPFKNTPRDWRCARIVDLRVKRTEEGHALSTWNLLRNRLQKHIHILTFTRKPQENFIESVRGCMNSYGSVQSTVCHRITPFTQYVNKKRANSFQKTNCSPVTNSVPRAPTFLEWLQTLTPTR